MTRVIILMLGFLVGAPAFASGLDAGVIEKGDLPELSILDIEDIVIKVKAEARQLVPMDLDFQTFEVIRSKSTDPIKVDFHLVKSEGGNFKTGRSPPTDLHVGFNYNDLIQEKATIDSLLDAGFAENALTCRLARDGLTRK